jgi:hypothetical protein
MFGISTYHWFCCPVRCATITLCACCPNMPLASLPVGLSGCATHVLVPGWQVCPGCGAAAVRMLALLQYLRLTVPGHFMNCVRARCSLCQPADVQRVRQLVAVCLRLVSYLALLPSAAGVGPSAGRHCVGGGGGVSLGCTMVQLVLGADLLQTHATREVP